jgi:penicillin-binding protein 2
MENFGSPIRKRIFLVIIIGFFSLLVLQLFNMQILQADIFDQKSRDNSIKGFTSDAPRGVYFDRNMNVVVSNKPSFTLQITPSFYDTTYSHMIETAIGEDSGYIDKILYLNRRYSNYSPRSIKRDIDFQTVAWIEENTEILKGVSYRVELQRDYSYGITGSHIFGYIKEISPDKLKMEKDLYSLGDLVGNSGIEKKYEKYLKGEKGVNYFVVDARQKMVGKYANGKNDELPVKGKDLVLTIDGPTQKIAEKLMKGKKGAVVALDPKTGEILALVSAPDYNLSDFASVTSQEIMSNLTNDPDKPLFNRATSSIYSPGSTHKMVGAIAGLEEGIITENTVFTCEGGIFYGDRFFKCLHVDGQVRLERALEHSCNTYFYKLILQVGLDKWAKYGKLLGFGQKLNLDIGEETAGLLPDRDYYDRVYGKNKWPRGLVVNLGIGQGELGVTPLQLAYYISLIANDGIAYPPHFVKGYVDERGNVTEFVYPEKNVGISKKTFDIIRKALFKVVNGEGTAGLIRMKNLKIAGKTGTAQNPFGKEHAIFVGFAPYDDPQIAVAVIIENAGYGGTHAAPVVKELMKTYLKVDDEPAPQIAKEKIMVNVAEEVN